MKEYSLSPIPKNEPDYSTGSVSRAPQNQPPANVSKETSRANQAKATPQASYEPVGQPKDTCLRFKVDENTNDVTVYVLDRSSRQILRTIPADQMRKLQSGDLLDLLS